MIYQLVSVATIDGITILYRFIFFAAIGLVLVQQFLGNTIEAALWERDCFSQNRIRPRLYGILIRFSFLVFLLVALGLMIVEHNDTFLVFLLIVFIGFSFLCANTYATKLTYNDTHLTYTHFRKERKISWKDVEQLSWRSEKKDMCYELVIQLNTGEIITLSQSVFVGLRNMEEFYEQQKKP